MKVTVSLEIHGVEYTVTGYYTPGWPGVRYYPDGSGSPPEGLEFDIVAVRDAAGLPAPESVLNGLTEDYDRLYEATEAALPGRRGGG